MVSGCPSADERARLFWNSDPEPPHPTRAPRESPVTRRSTICRHQGLHSAQIGPAYTL